MLKSLQHPEAPAQPETLSRVQDDGGEGGRALDPRWRQFLRAYAATVAALLIVLGLAGAGFALRSVTRADPLTALGSAR